MMTEGGAYLEFAGQGVWRAARDGQRSRPRLAWAGAANGLHTLSSPTSGDRTGNKSFFHEGMPEVVEGDLALQTLTF